MLYHYKIASIDKVIDGDTFVCNVDLGFDVRMRMHIRLFGVNTPELHGTHAKAALKAKQYTIDWLANRDDLTIQSNKYDEREKYGRALGTIYRGDEPESLNAALLREGLAKVMV